MSNFIKLKTRMCGGVFTTTASNQYEISKDELWGRVCHPTLLSVPCLHLDEFNTDLKLCVGNPVHEVHNFFGLKQVYEGKILSTGDSNWSMKTWPVSKKTIFGLPHSVSYTCAGGSSDSELSVECSYKPTGLFNTPGLRWLIKKEMEKTIRILLESPIKQK